MPPNINAIFPSVSSYAVGHWEESAEHKKMKLLFQFWLLNSQSGLSPPLRFTSEYNF
jgi:hypothetical protein